MRIKLITFLIAFLSYTGLQSQDGSYSVVASDDGEALGQIDNKYKKSEQSTDFHGFAKVQQIEDLELIPNYPIKQLVSEWVERFDLSGIVEYQGSLYIIADKAWNNHLYKIDTSQTNFNIVKTIELCVNTKIDLEGIDICDDKFYLIEEEESDVYQGGMESCQLKKLPVPWERFNIDRTKWGNTGFEGIAFDCENQLLYLAKEREPRRIFLYDFKKDVITEPLADLINSNVEGFDISDLKYENGALYILERGLGLVTKIDLKTNAKKSVSFQHIVLNNKQRLYINSNYKFGMAEALLLTKDQIWIGLDNNGDQVSDYGKSMGLRDGNQPVFLIFKRPAGF